MPELSYEKGGCFNSNLMPFSICFFTFNGCFFSFYKVGMKSGAGDIKRNKRLCYHLTLNAVGNECKKEKFRKSYHGKPFPRYWEWEGRLTATLIEGLWELSDKFSWKKCSLMQILGIRGFPGKWGTQRGGKHSRRGSRGQRHGYWKEHVSTERASVLHLELILRAGRGKKRLEEVAGLGHWRPCAHRILLLHQDPVRMLPPLGSLSMHLKVFL